MFIPYSLYQQQNSLKIPQMKLAQQNSSNPTLLVSDISDLSPQRQESMIIGQNNESLDRYKTSSSLLLPQVIRHIQKVIDVPAL